MRVPFESLHHTLTAVLARRGMSPERAQACARLFVDASADGVASRGLNRFPRFLRMIDNGSIDVAAGPIQAQAFGALERWDGRRGPGNLNATAATARACDLAREHGIGCVALANTTPWMRGGSYGWQAAEAGFAAVCWTHTLANVPPWGATEPRQSARRRRSTRGRPRRARHGDVAILRRRPDRPLASRRTAAGRGGIRYGRGPDHRRARHSRLEAAAADRLVERSRIGADARSARCRRLGWPCHSRNRDGSRSRGRGLAGVRRVCARRVDRRRRAGPFSWEHARRATSGERVLAARERSRRDGVEVDERIWQEIQAI